MGDVFVLFFDKNSQGGWEEMSAEKMEDTHIFLFSEAHGVVISTNQILVSPIYLDLFPGAIENRVGTQVRGLNSALLAGLLLFSLHENSGS